MIDKKKILVVSVALLAFTSIPQAAHAAFEISYSSDRHGRYDRHDRHDRYDHHSRYNHRYDRPYHRYYYPDYGRAVVTLPGGYVSVVFGGRRYYYGDGIFYRRATRNYEVVAPPFGAVIRVLPNDCDRIVVRGNIYYVRSGVYYRPARSGYEVVAQPDIIVESAAPVQVDDLNNDGVVVNSSNNVQSGSYTVNIPNKNGNYTAVVIKKSGEGYAGPQGEFYNTFPSVEQLQAMYGK